VELWLFNLGLSNAVTATVLAIAVACVTYFCRRPALAHGLWLLVLLKLLTPPLWSVALPEVTMPELAQADSADGALANPPLVSGTTEIPEFGPAPDKNETAALPEPVPAAGNVPAKSESPQAAKVFAPSPLPWVEMAVNVWLTGTALWLALAGWRLQRFRWRLRQAEFAPPAVQARARELAARLKLHSCPGVWLVAARLSPLVWALTGKPRLLLPAALWHGLSAEQRDTLLVHELAHLRRRDHWVRLLELAALSLYWWHPVVWWVQRRLQESEEECCDSWVLELFPASAEAYAEALVETVCFLSQARTSLPLGASGVGQVHVLKRRLIMILEGKLPRALPRIVQGTVLAAGIVLVSLVPTWAQSDQPKIAVSSITTTDKVADPRDSDDQIERARQTVRRLEAELRDLQSEMQGVSASLSRARARLARLEGRTEQPKGDWDKTEHAKLPANSVPKGDWGKVEGAKMPADSVPHADHAPAKTPAPANRRFDDSPRPKGADNVAKMPPDLPSAAMEKNTRHEAWNRFMSGDYVAPSHVRSGDDHEKRLRDLETKLDALIKEIRALRPDRSDTSGAAKKQ
jgi:beta-lactamase regulating signal transducer with metallopeptidase domain